MQRKVVTEIQNLKHWNKIEEEAENIFIFNVIAFHENL